MDTVHMKQAVRYELKGYKQSKNTDYLGEYLTFLEKREPHLFTQILQLKKKEAAVGCCTLISVIFPQFFII